MSELEDTLNITTQMEKLRDTEGGDLFTHSLTLKRWSSLRGLGHVHTTKMERMCFCLQGLYPLGGRIRGEYVAVKEH